MTKRDKEIAALKSEGFQKISSLESELTDIKQVYIDETEGVRGQYTTGKVGTGPRAKEYQADIRKTQAKNDLEVKKINQEIKIEEDRIIKEYDKKIELAQTGLDEINNLVSSDAKAKGLLYQVNNATNFSDLAKITITVNNSISNISSKMGLEPKFVSYTTDDVIQLSFGALFRGEITALICFLLAFLLEMVDIIIVFMMRGTRKEEEKIPEVEEDKRKFFKTYTSEIAPEKSPESIESVFYPYKNYTKQ